MKIALKFTIILFPKNQKQVGARFSPHVSALYTAIREETPGQYTENDTFAISMYSLYHPKFLMKKAYC